MRELCLHILDIAANSVSAGANRIVVSIEEDEKQDLLSIKISDNGCGIDAETLQQIADPFVTSRTTRPVGMGIPLLKAAAETCNGSFAIRSMPGEGTDIEVSFQLSHIDRMPLGEVAETLLGLELGTPDVNWVFNLRCNEIVFNFDDLEFKRELDGLSLTDPVVIRCVRAIFVEGLEPLHCM